MKNLVVTEEIWKEGNMYTAYCPELDVISCGRDIDESASSAQSATLRDSDKRNNYRNNL